MSLSSHFRQQIVAVLEAALRAVDPRAAVAGHVVREGDVLHVAGRTYRLDEIERVLVVGGGKAAAPMAAALADILGDRLTAGVVTVKYGHTSGHSGGRVRWGEVTPNPPPPFPAREGGDSLPSSTRGGVGGEVSPPVPPKLGRPGGPGAGGEVDARIRIVEAGHPVPDAAGQAGAEQIAALLQGLSPRDLVFVLISGGGSALLPLPVAGVSLADMQALTQALLRCGADITEINTIRKHCSRLQGGQLARLAAPAQVISLILSDVVGSPLDAIASGPTVPDPTTYDDALAVLRRYDLLEQIPAGIRRHLEAGAAGARPETPKPGDPLFDRVVNVVIGDNASAGRAAVAEARRQGFKAALLTTFVQGEAREVGRVVAGLAQGIAAGQSDFARPACLVLGGETTVTLRGQGKGGRNQELALAAGIALDGYVAPVGVELAVISLGTDGTDGPTDAAGGLATVDTLARGRALGLDGRAALARNDSYPYLAAIGDLIVTGPTNTNVNDLIFVFVS